MRILSLALSVASACAFMPTAFRHNAARSFSLSMVDSTAAIEEAMAATKEFGSTSPEARAAWDIVEEIDASNRHHKSDDIHVAKQASSSSEHEDTVYEKFCHDNDAGAGDIKAAQTRMEALKDAERITKEKGATSPEAALAWELVEELAATDSHHKTTGAG